ncbi:MAG: hypothetical protein SW019_12040 [Actinomycetota bacterium]|nr:hypothetical protein [Actinomycetota bacterium]
MSDDDKDDKATAVTGDEPVEAGDAAPADEPETGSQQPEPDADAGTAESETSEEAETTDETEDGTPAEAAKRPVPWSRVVAFTMLPALALVLALGAGYLKWQANSVRNAQLAAQTSVQAATDSTIALLSYSPDTVEEQLGAARDLLTGEFQESYTDLTNDVVIPGAKEQQITAVASVPAAASVSADPDEAVVLLFVNQTVTVGQEPPTDTASSVRVTLEKAGDRWLISQFDPV